MSLVRVLGQPFVALVDQPRWPERTPVSRPTTPMRSLCRPRPGCRHTDYRLIVRLAVGIAAADRSRL